MRHHLLIFLYGAILLLPFLDNGTVLSRHEVLAAEPAREMLEAGAPWSIQTFAGQPRTDKPPTMSWLIALSMKLFDSRSEFVCRLPAAIAGIIAAHAIAVIGARLISPIAGLLSGLITLTTYWLQMQARLSESDMPLTAAVCVAMVALLLPREADAKSESFKSSTWRSLLFYAATGFGFLLKGIAPLVTIPAAMLLAVWAKDISARRAIQNPFGIAVFLALLTVWPVVAYLNYPPILDAWYLHLFGRAAGQLEGRDPMTALRYAVEFFYYFWTIPWLILPATPVVAIGLYNACDRWRSSRTARFLIAWVVPFLIVLTLSAWKHKHYALPILPAFSVLAGYGTVIWMNSMRNPFRAKQLLVIWFTGCAAAILFAQAKILPRFDGYRAQAEFARQVNAILPESQVVTLVGLREAHLAFYLNAIPNRIDDPATIQPGRSFYAICDRRTYDSLQTRVQMEKLAQAVKLRSHETEAERLILARVNQ